ncbi:MAG: hypothetical protein IPO19_15280 [Rhodoferax sp.]|nr:hypothetical protein [Rhodoferax sp.]
MQSFEAFIAQHKDEITALQILYSRPTRAPLKFEDVQALADALHAPPVNIDEGALWQAYATLRKDKVKGATQCACSPIWSAWCALPCSRPTSWCPTPSACRPTSKPGWPSTSRQIQTSSPKNNNTG